MNRSAVSLTNIKFTVQISKMAHLFGVKLSLEERKYLYPREMTLLRVKQTTPQISYKGFNLEYRGSIEGWIRLME